MSPQHRSPFGLRAPLRSLAVFGVGVLLAVTIEALAADALTALAHALASGFVILSVFAAVGVEAKALHNSVNYNIPTPRVTRTQFGANAFPDTPMANVVVLGDSIGAGAQAIQRPGVVPEAAFPMAIAELAAGRLRQQVQLHMLAIVGGIFSDLDRQIDKAVTNLADSRADIVLVVSGSNDARRRYMPAMLQAPYSNAIIRIADELRAREIVFATCPQQDCTFTTNHPLVRAAYGASARRVRRMQQRVIRWRREMGIPITELDLSEVSVLMRRSPHWFNPGDAHLNSVGSRAVAEHLFRGSLGAAVDRVGLELMADSDPELVQLGGHVNDDLARNDGIERDDTAVERDLSVEGPH